MWWRGEGGGGARARNHARTRTYGQCFHTHEYIGLNEYRSDKAVTETILFVLKALNLSDTFQYRSHTSRAKTPFHDKLTCL